jgi:hypothetical protein
LVACPRQADVKSFTGALEGRLFIDNEHHGAALEALEAENMAVEDLVGFTSRRSTISVRGNV